MDELCLRQLLLSAHGEKCGAAILDGVAHGKPLVVVKNDGNKVTLADTTDALNMLRDMGWKLTYAPVPQKE